MDSLIPGLTDDLGRACLIRVPFQDLPTISAVCRAWSAEIRLSEFRRLRKAAGVTRPLLVLAQARHHDPNQSPADGIKPSLPVYGLTAFDPLTGSWSSLPAIPAIPEGLPMFCGLVGCGSDLLVMGGWNPSTWRVSKEVFVYNFSSGKWRQGSDMPGPRRSFFGCASSDPDRSVLVAGGHDEDKNALRSAILYDVAEDRWVPLPDMARERDECKVVFQRGRFHVVSGYPTATQGQFERTAEAFDHATWQWGPVVKDFLEPSASPSSCMGGPGGRMFAFTGHRSDDVAVQEGDKWHVAAKVPNDVCCSHWGAACWDKMMVIGSSKFGEDQNGYVLDLEIYKWSRIDMHSGSGHVQCVCVMEI